MYNASIFSLALAPVVSNYIYSLEHLYKSRGKQHGPIDMSIAHGINFSAANHFHIHALLGYCFCFIIKNRDAVNLPFSYSHVRPSHNVFGICGYTLYNP